ncbi:MAG: hypothetical protein ACLQVN_19400 [Bryobacteraceae bacterium]
MQKNATLIGILFLAAATIPAGFADMPGRHAHYLRARTDLRSAQWLLRVHDEPNVMSHIRAVDQEIDRAVFEMDRAAALDRKDLLDHPRVDERLDRAGRFRRAMELLREARAEIDREEDNPRAREWRDRAFGHIDAAIDQLRRAARDLRLDHLVGF